MQKLETIVNEKIHPHDYETQIARWNRYIEVLKKIKYKAKAIRGVSLSENINSNINKMGDRHKDINGFGFIPLLFIIATLPALSDQDYTSYAIGAILAIVSISSIIAFNGYIPRRKHDTLNISCNPVLHINEMEFVHTMISGIPEVKKDPEIYLPALSLSIPRQWITTESTRRVMEQMDKIKGLDNYE
jgi:hypothetical protein